MWVRQNPCSCIFHAVNRAIPRAGDFTLQILLIYIPVIMWKISMASNAPQLLPLFFKNLKPPSLLMKYQIALLLSYFLKIPLLLKKIT